MTKEELEKNIERCQKKQLLEPIWTDDEAQIIKEILTPFLNRNYSVNKVSQFLKMVSDKVASLVTL